MKMFYQKFAYLDDFITINLSNLNQFMNVDRFDS